MNNKKTIVTSMALLLSFGISANTVTSVGLGPMPAYQPNRGDWTLTTSCIDINESGEAACMAQATGYEYHCSWRQRNRLDCRTSRVHQVYKWDGSELILMSDPNEILDYAKVINENGEIAGYKLSEYNNSHFLTYINNGARIWTAPEQFEVKNFAEIISLNNDSSYIGEWRTSSGGQTYYHSQLFHNDGSEISFPGIEARPFVVSNNGDVIGGQIIQSFSAYSEIPEVSGIGWLYNQSELDMLPINEVGLFDVDGSTIWPSGYGRGLVNSHYRSTALSRVNDVNDLGEYIVSNKNGIYTSSALCSPIGESSYTKPNGQEEVLPWKCYSNPGVATNDKFVGLNELGDVVGTQTPKIPTVWLVNDSGSWDVYNANDLLPINSGYSVLTVNEINNSRQIVGSCLNSLSEQVGCIINVTDQVIPTSLIKPIVKINNPQADSTVSGTVTINAEIWDRDDTINKVTFKIDSTKIAVDRTYPYSIELDTSTLSEGSHKIKVIAQDNSGLRTVKRINITIASGTQPPPVNPPTNPPVNPPTPPAGEVIEGEGIIQAIGVDNITLDGAIYFYDANTVIKYNDVPGFAIGLNVQYKAIVAADGKVTATDFEVN